MRLRVPTLAVAVALALGWTSATATGAGASAAAPPAPPAMQWTPVTTHGGGWVTGLVTSPSGAVYARTDVGGAYRWNAAQDSWEQMLTVSGVPAPSTSDYGVESLAVAGRDGRTVYAAVGEGLGAAAGRVLRSRDGGRTWQDGGKRFRVSGNADWRWGGERLSVDPADVEVVLLGTRTEGVQRSQDGGRTWSRLPVPAGTSPAGVTFTLFDPASRVVGGRTQGAWVGVADVGVFRTDDAGRSFRLLHPIRRGVPRDVERSSDGALYVVVDGGSHQVLRIDPRTGAVADVSPDPGGGFAMVAVDPRDPARVFVGDDGVRDGKLWRSTDAGRSWAALDVALSADPDSRWATTADIDRWMSGGALAFDPVRPGRLWFAEGMGVWRSDDLADGEVTWRFTSDGIEELVSNAAVKPAGRPLITASWDRGLFRHPTPETGGATLPYRRDFGSAWDLTASPTDPDFLVAVLDDHQDRTGQRHPDRRASAWSRDGGATWTRFAALAAGTAPKDMMFGNAAVSAGDHDNIVWTPSGTTTPKAYFTRDRGATWSPGVLSGAAAGDYLHPAHYLKRKTLAADPLIAGSFYALGGNDRTGDSALWKTVDGGATWNKVTSTSGPGRRAYWDFRFNSRLIALPGRSGHLLALPGVTDSGDHPYWRSTDGGRSWTEVTGLRDAHDIGVGAPLVEGGSPTLFGYGKVRSVRGLYRSTDLGATWTFLTAHPRGWYQSVAAVVGDPEVPGKVYVGFAGGGFVQGRPTGTAGVAGQVPRSAAAPVPTVRLSGVRPDVAGAAVRRGALLTVTGVVAPGRAGTPVALQVQQRTGWRTVARAVSVSKGAVAVPYRAPAARGTTVLRLATGAPAWRSGSAAFTVRTG